MTLVNTLVYLAVVIIVIIIIVWALKFLFGILAIAPAAYGQVDLEDNQKVVDKVETTVNDTDITVTCTSNIPDLVSCD